MPGVAHAPSVLVADDNPAMRALIRSLVEGVSSAVHECADGAQCVALYAQVHPDWVVMDIRMEGMDGLEAARRIRQADAGARIVIVTEHRDPEYRRAALAAGAAGFVLKEDLLDLPALLVPPSEGGGP